jgi:hypothetical protein
VEEPTQHAPDPSLRSQPGAESGAQPVSEPERETGPRAAGPDPSGLDDSGLDDSGLGERDLRVLAFERQWWRHAGAKEQAIREDFGLSSARYYQILGALIDSPAALAHDPMLVKRLQRVRDSRAATRADRARRMGDDLRRRSDRLD